MTNYSDLIKQLSDARHKFAKQVNPKCGFEKQMVASALHIYSELINRLRDLDSYGVDMSFDEVLQTIKDTHSLIDNIRKAIESHIREVHNKPCLNVGNELDIAKTSFKQHSEVNPRDLGKYLVIQPCRSKYLKEFFITCN